MSLRNGHRDDRMWIGTISWFIRIFGADGGDRLVVDRESRGVKDALTQEVELGAAVHDAFDQLERVDLPLDGTVAPTGA